MHLNFVKVIDQGKNADLKKKEKMAFSKFEKQKQTKKKKLCYDLDFWQDRQANTRPYEQQDPGNVKNISLPKVYFKSM